MGVFLVGSLIWMTAILLDKNRVFPMWFGYLNLCNALTEVVVAPSWMFHRGVFAWNGVIAWWINVVVFGVYTGAFITLLRNDDPPRGLRCRAAARPAAEEFAGYPLRRRWRRDDHREDHAIWSTPRRKDTFPGQPDMWFFVLFESMVFTSYFCVYLFYRTQTREVLPSCPVAPPPLARQCFRHDRPADQFVGRGPLRPGTRVPGAYQHCDAGCVADGRLRRRLPRAQDHRVGQADPHEGHLHERPVLPVLLLPHRQSTASTC